MNESSTLRVGSGGRSIPESTAEVDSTEAEEDDLTRFEMVESRYVLIGVHVSVGAGLVTSAVEVVARVRVAVQV